MVHVNKYKRDDGTKVVSHSRSTPETDLKYGKKDLPSSFEKKSESKEKSMQDMMKREEKRNFDLDTRFDSRGSFYGKAKVEVRGNNQKLYSYATLVAEITGDEAIVYGQYSQTTSRHVKEFLLQNGFKAVSTKQILKDYMRPNR